MAAVPHCDMIEVDVRSSRDGELVLSHDPDLTGLPVSGTSWEELSRVELAPGVTPTRLTGVLERIGSHPLNIEIKHLPGDPGFDPNSDWPLEAAQLARTSDIVTSFNWRTIDRIKSELGITTGLLVSRHTPLIDAIDLAVRGGHRWVMAEWALIERDPEMAAITARGDGLELGVWTVNDPETAKRLVDAGAAALITDDPIAMRQVLELA